MLLQNKENRLSGFINAINFSVCFLFLENVKQNNNKYELHKLCLCITAHEHYLLLFMLNKSY